MSINVNLLIKFCIFYKLDFQKGNNISFITAHLLPVHTFPYNTTGIAVHGRMSLYVFGLCHPIKTSKFLAVVCSLVTNKPALQAIKLLQSMTLEFHLTLRNENTKITCQVNYMIETEFHTELRFSFQEYGSEKKNGQDLKKRSGC